MDEVINIQQAKTHLSRLVEDVVAGEEVVVGKAGKPLVRLVPYRAPRSERQGGQFAGRIRESEDCWNPEEDPFERALETPVFPQSPPRSLPRVADDPSNG